jgi:hypothetical protein
MHRSSFTACFNAVNKNSYTAAAKPHRLVSSCAGVRVRRYTAFVEYLESVPGVKKADK